MTAIESGLRELVLRLVREDSELRREIAALVGDTDELLTIKAGAAVASVSPATVSRWIRTGTLAATGTGKSTRIRRADLLDHLQRGGRRDVPLEPERLAELEEAGR